MARTFNDILSQVTAQSDPQRKIVLNQIADLPNQQAAQTSALGAQKDQAYGDILNGAQERGLGFSGIPLAEQAKYNATTYAPALANLGTSFNNQKSSLESALAGIGSNDYSTANTIYSQAQQLAEQQREFNANLALQRQSAPDPLAALLASSLGNASAQTKSTPTPQLLSGGRTKQQAANDVTTLLNTNDANWVRKNILGIYKSAQNGNTYDQAKLEILSSSPNKNVQSLLQQTLANLNGATF